MSTMSITVGETARFIVPPPTQEQLRRFGGAMVARLQDRVASFRNADDAPARPYSLYGPIYIPVTGVGTILKLPSRTFGVSKADLLRGTPKDRLSVFLEKRTKAALGGREVITPKDLAKLKARGVVGRSPTALGSVTPSGKSVKFANRAAWKKALGKTGNRDLEVSHRMLGALTIVGLTASTVTIGFTREAEEQKAQWNQAIDPWFGLSPSDIEFLEALAATL